MMVAGTDKRLYSINVHTGGVVNGLTPDGRAVVQRAREESTQYEGMFGIRIPGAVLADRLALQFQMKTIYSSYRPIGTSLIMANHDKLKGFQLYMIEPSGLCHQYYGCSSGRGKQFCRNEIEKTNFRELTVEQALPKVAKILLQAQEEMKDKKQELELSFISESSQFRHKILERPAVDALTEQAMKEIKGDDVDMK
jgi:20S proteasome subunit alpha 7